MRTPIPPLLIPPLLCLTLASCAPPDIQAVSDGPASMADTCGAAGLSSYQGRPATALPGTGPWTALRVIRPGMMVTMDHSATRLNLHVDGADRILSLSCG